MRADVAVIGAGIVGLTHAYAAARAGRKVVVFERNGRASGASVRNFGMIWPIGQPTGVMYDLALRSRELWREFLDEAGLPYRPTGSLHLAYRQDEADVAQEYAGIAECCEWLDADAVIERSSAVNPVGLLGGIWSPVEMTVDPRTILAAMPRVLTERFGVQIRYSAPVRRIQLPVVETAAERWEVEQAIVCGGDDFETLYPKVFAASGITRCKLQMMRTVPQPRGWRLGPALAGGLTLRFYSSFRVCSTLPKLQARIAREMPEYDRWGIHVMASETDAGEVTIGDSHEYGSEVDIFDKPEIDDLILRYLKTFVRLPALEIAQRWHGVYAKHPELPYFTAAPQPGVQIVTATGGAGMTLSFGLAERTWREMQ
jgi:FAD dependent oxidoreductase TIGR03364